jgi:hypothetical protein
MAALGRPRKEFDKEQFEKLCALQCKEEEIAGWFGICEDTLVTRCRETYDGKTFSEIYKVLCSDGKIGLRRSQYRLAEKSAAMAIWLGKQHLDQHDDPMIDARTFVQNVNYGWQSEDKENHNSVLPAELSEGNSRIPVEIQSSEDRTPRREDGTTD